MSGLFFVFLIVVFNINTPLSLCRNAEHPPPWRVHLPGCNLVTAATSSIQYLDCLSRSVVHHLSASESAECVTKWVIHTS